MTTTLDLTKLRYHIKTPRYQIILCDTAWIRVMQSTHARRSQATQSTSAMPWHFSQGGQLVATISTLEGTNLNIESCKSSLYCTPFQERKQKVPFYLPELCCIFFTIMSSSLFHSEHEPFLTLCLCVLGARLVSHSGAGMT